MTPRDTWLSGASMVLCSSPRAARKLCLPLLSTSTRNARSARVAAMTSSSTVFNTSSRSRDEVKVCDIRYSKLSRSVWREIPCPKTIHLPPEVHGVKFLIPIITTGQYLKRMVMERLNNHNVLILFSKRLVRFCDYSAPAQSH